jgi:hypothetical protein
LFLWPRWTYDNQAKPQDPLNIIFKGVKLDEILTYLDTKGWNANVVFAFNQYLPIDDLHHLKMQDAQFQFGNIGRRVHARFWELGADVVGNVHHEVASIPQHKVLDYHAAEMYLANVCKDNKNWSVQEDSQEMQNFFGGHGMPYNDGKATLVTG